MDPARAALDRILREVIEGTSSEVAFVLNRGDRGLLSSLDALPAQAASAQPGGRTSIAAHVDHLRYGFSLLNRWAKGEDPWHDADYSASWQRQHVTDAEWVALRQALATEARAWMAAVREPRDWDIDGWSNALASAVHLTYHLGAIRQLDPATRGPKETDDAQTPPPE